MKKKIESGYLSLILGSVTLVLLLFSALALTDIFHSREPDLSNEWHVVRISLSLATISIILLMSTIIRKT